MKTYRTRIEVRGYELDSYGHVNNAQYLHYLEHARWKMLEEESITLPKLREWRRSPVISAMELKYLKPAFMDDMLDVETRCIEDTRTSFVFEQTILKNTVLIFKARVQVVIVNELGRPAETPPEMDCFRSETK